MLEEKDKAKYYIERIRTIGKSSTTWSLLFLYAILSSLSSIYPKYVLFAEVVNLSNQVKYLNNIQNRLRNKRDTVLLNFNDTLQNYRVFKKPVLNTLRDRLRTSKFMSSKKSDSLLNVFYSSIALTQVNNENSLLISKSRRTLNGNIKPINDKIDSLALNKMPLVAAKNDSLTKAQGIKFDIPGFKSFELPTRIGSVAWIVLTLIFMTVMFSRRRTMVGYIRRLYKSYRYNLKIPDEEFGYLDLQLPFWISPLNVQKTKANYLAPSMINWRYPRFNHILSIIVLLFIYIIIAAVSWFNWNFNSKQYYEYGLLYQIVTLLLFSTATFLIILWLKPLNIYHYPQNSEIILYERRDLIKAGSAYLLLMLLLPIKGVTKLVPAMKPGLTGFERFKKKRKTLRIWLPEGFYEHNDSGNKVIHYIFANGKSFTGNTLNNIQIRNLKRELKKVEVKDLISYTNFANLSIPHWQYVLEHKGVQFAKQQLYYEGISTILFALSYNIGRYGFGFHKTNERLAYLLSALRIMHESKLKDAQKKSVSYKLSIIQNLAAGTNKLSEHDKLVTIMQYPESKDSKFYKRWSTKKNFDWKLPTLVF